MQQLIIEIVSDNGSAVLQSVLANDMSAIISGKRNKEFDDGSQIGLSEGYLPSENFGLYEAIPFVLTFISGVGAQVLASWIYDKIKDSDKHAKITYRGRIIPLDDLGDLIKELNRALDFESKNDKRKKKHK